MLKQASIRNRTAFLQLFTKELILNSQHPNFYEKRPVAENKKAISQPITLDKKPEGMGEYFASEKLDYHEIKHNQPQKIAYKTKAIPAPKAVPKRKVISKPQIVLKRNLPPKKIIVPMKRKPIRGKITSPIDKTYPNIPSTQLIAHELDLGKLGILLTDKEVTVIECPGPDNFIFVKKAGKVNLTRIKLSQEEIDRILDSFSAKARIPLMEGVFKAIVGDLSINAIITNSSGNRFMIYKKTLYSYIERN